jgi:anthranilate phosphoribosyltransferase
MKKILNYLLEHKSLNKETAKEVMLGIGKQIYNDAEIAAFLTVYLMRSITIEELQGFRDALLEICLPVKLDMPVTTDIVGTGGDGKNTFNISTLSAFLVAGAGYKVAKHGNYGVSSISGSSNVMEALGYRFTSEQDKLNTELEKTGITFLHAPLFHPALKTVAAIRKNLGLRTIFNMLGPLVNPAQPSHTILGVYNLEIARYYTYLLQQSTTHFTIVHTMDGYDEISLTDDAKLITRDGETIFSPEQLGNRTVKEQDIYGGQSVADAAKLFVEILNGTGTWAQNAVVMTNAAVAITNMEKTISYKEAYNKAVESLETGAAKKVLDTLITLQ